MDEISKKLGAAQKNYRLAVRWYRDVLAYRASVRGDEWKAEGKWLVDDAELAYKEVVEDIQRFRKEINSLKRQLGRK